MTTLVAADGGADGAHLQRHFEMADRAEAVREFVTVTDVDEERALFFLESAGWDLQVCGSNSPQRRRHR